MAVAAGYLPIFFQDSFSFPRIAEEGFWCDHPRPAKEQ
jgi:hypothetical protein